MAVVQARIVPNGEQIRHPFRWIAAAALRQLLLLDAEDRDILLALIPTELAANLIEEAPVQAATDLIERLTTERAAEVLDELNSDLQADIIGHLGDEDSHEILARLHPDDAASHDCSGHEPGCSRGPF